MTDASPHLDDLLGKLRDGELDEAAAAELERLVLDDPSAMDRLIHHRWIDAGLTERFGEPRTLPSISQHQTPARAASAGRPNRYRIAPVALSIAAALLLAAAAFAIYVFAVSRPLFPAPSSSAPIAMLIDADTTVLVDDDIANPGSEYRAGRYLIETGSADLQLTSGASVRMIGSTELTMHTAMRSTLTRGAAVFNCPESAVGYTVDLPNSVRIVDLGTRFAVRIDDAGRAVVQVIDGRVRIDTPTGSHELNRGAAHEVVGGVSNPLTDITRLIVPAWAPPADATLLISDSFDMTDGDLQERNADVASSDRQAGPLAPIDWTYAKAVHRIEGGRIRSSEIVAQHKSGRVFLDHDFTDAVLTGDRGFLVEYDFVPGDASTDWIMITIGMRTGSAVEAGTLEANGNLTGVTDFGLLVRNNGGFEVFKDNNASPAASGGAIASPRLTAPYRVQLTVRTANFDEGTRAFVSAAVNGETLDLNGDADGTDATFTWDADGTNYIAWESNQSVSHIDNIAVYSRALSPDETASPTDAIESSPRPDTPGPESETIDR